MIWVRGARADYDTGRISAPKAGRGTTCCPVFERIERRAPGDGGIVNILTGYEADPIHQAIVAAAQECGIPFNADYNGATQDGVSYMQYSIENGIRHSTAAAYLRPIVGHPNLRVVLRARASRLLFEGTRCVGVEFVRDGKVERKHASEVIVSGGTIGSPQLLLLSGVGPADELRGHGIEVVADLPGVGGTSTTTCSRRSSSAPSARWARRRPAYPPVRRTSSGDPGPGSSFRTSSRSTSWSRCTSRGWRARRTASRSWVAWCGPLSRGTIRLSGATIDDPPLIDPNVLACEADLESLVAAVELCRRIGASDALRGAWGAVERYPGPDVSSPEEVRRYVRDTAITYHHQVGTCKMGLDEAAVVDPRLRVHGIDGLRVGDASVMPTVPTGNTNAPSIMIGERVADFVTGERPPGGLDGRGSGGVSRARQPMRARDERCIERKPDSRRYSRTIGSPAQDSWAGVGWRGMTSRARAVDFGLGISFRFTRFEGPGDDMTNNLAWEGVRSDADLAGAVATASDEAAGSRQRAASTGGQTKGGSA